MIVRIWHGWATGENAEAYERLVDGTIVPGIIERRVPGLRSVEVLRRRDEQETADLRREMRRRGADDPRACLLSLFDILRDWFDDPAFSGCIFMNAAVAFPSTHDPVHAAAAAHGVNIHRVLLEFAREAGSRDADLLARQFLLLLQGSLAARYVSGEASAADLARSTAEVLLDTRLGTAAQPAG